MLQAAAVLGNTRVITQHSRRAGDANKPWWWPPYTSPWPWEIPLHPKDSDVALELAEQSRKILPVLLLTITEKEPAPALTCNQRKTKWPQRLLQVPEEHWASHQKMGSAQSVHGRCLSQSLWPSVFSYHFCKTRRLCQRTSRLKVFLACVYLGVTPRLFPPVSLTCFPAPLCANTEHYRRVNVPLNLLSDRILGV